MAIITFMVCVIWFCFAQDLVFCDDYGESGNKITLTPIIRGKPEEILWTHNGNKVVEFDGSEVVKYGSFKDRVDVDFETGQLTIRKLNSQDSGKYQSEIWINGEAQISSHTLTVLESQTQPSYQWSGPDIKEPGPTFLVDELEEKSGGVNPAVLVPVVIVSVLLIILLAVLVFYFYRCKKQKSRESDRKKMDTENGECNNLLRNVPMETRKGQKLLKESLQSAIPEKNKEDTGGTNEEELDKNEKNCKNADKAEENGNSKPDEKDIKTIESKKSLQPQEGQKEKSQILKNKKTEDTDIHNDQTPEDKKEKEEENKEIDSLNTGESNNLLRNVTMEAMPDSLDATLPCRTRLTAPQESIADKKWDHDSESENLGETHEGQKLLKESLQSAVPEKNKEDTGSTNEEEQDKHVKNSKNADKAEENVNSEPDEKDIKTIESEKSLQTQEEREKEKNQILKNESENEEKSHEEETETIGDQKTEDADKNEDDQTPEDKKEKEEENKGMGRPNTGESNNLLRNFPMEAMPGLSDVTLPCRTRLTAPKESIAGLENAGETHEGQKLLKESLQSEKNREDTGNINNGELDKDETNGENAGEAPENVNTKPDETDREVESQKFVQMQEEMDKEKSQTLKIERENEENSPEDQTETLTDLESKNADKNEEGQTPEVKKEEKEQHKKIDSLNTDSPANLEEELRNISVPSSNQSAPSVPELIRQFNRQTSDQTQRTEFHKKARDNMDDRKSDPSASQLEAGPPTIDNSNLGRRLSILGQENQD